MDEIISGIEDTIEEITILVKENAKCKTYLTQKIQEIRDTMKRSNQWIIGIGDSEDTQFKELENIFSKNIEVNFSNLKKDGYKCTKGLQNNK